MKLWRLGNNFMYFFKVGKYFLTRVLLVVSTALTVTEILKGSVIGWVDFLNNILLVSEFHGNRKFLE